MAKKGRRSAAPRRGKRGGEDTGLILYRNIQRPQMVRTCRTNVSVLSIPPIDSGNYLTHSLDTLPGYAELVATFDMYRITKVEITFDAPYPNGGKSPILYWAQDNADAVAPASLTTITERSNLVHHQFSPTNNTFTRSYVPQCQAAAFQGVLPAYALQPPGTWISTQYPGVLHYGSKYWLQTYNSAAYTDPLVLVTKIWVECKGMK